MLLLTACFAAVLWSPAKIEAQAAEYNIGIFTGPSLGGDLCCPIGTSDQRLPDARGGICSYEMYTRANKSTSEFPCCGWVPAAKDSGDTAYIGAPRFEKKTSCEAVNPKNICNSIPEGKERAACNACKNKKPEEGGGVYTAIGCIPKQGDQLILALARVGIGLLGGVLLVIILAAAFKLTTSRGEPKAFEEGKSLLTAGITGALFILFSMVILETIGVNILKIPGF